MCNGQQIGVLLVFMGPLQLRNDSSHGSDRKPPTADGTAF